MDQNRSYANKNFQATGDIFYLWHLYLVVWTLVICQGTMRFYDDVIKRIFFRVTTPLNGIFLSPLDFHNKEQIMRALWFFYINLNKWFNKQPMLPLAMALMWRHCNGNAVYIYLIRAGIIYSTWFCCQWENVDVYFGWPENTLEQAADRAVILDPLFVLILLTKLRRGGFIRPRVIYHNWFPLEKGS